MIPVADFHALSMTMNSSSAGLAIWQAMDYELKEEAPPDQGLLERKSL
jgi:hypothetical protein